MGRIDRDQAGSLSVTIENEADAAQLRAAIKAADGADEVEVRLGHPVILSGENAFNYVALWSTDFAWSKEALALALDVLVPVARSALNLHTRSHRSMMMRFMPRPGAPSK